MLPKVSLPNLKLIQSQLLEMSLPKIPKQVKRLLLKVTKRKIQSLLQMLELPKKLLLTRKKLVIRRQPQLLVLLLNQPSQS